MHEACASIIGTHQSPINICEADCFEIRDALLIEAYDDESTRGCITGHDDHYTFELDVPGEGLRAPAVQFRSTKATLRSIHFHALSEHQLEKQKFSAEFHLVHEICSQATATDQYGQEPSSKIVIGVFANEVDDNEALQSLSLEFCKSLSIVKNAKEKSCVSDPFSFAELLKDAYSKLERFYHYRGSLSVQETFCKSGQKGETSVNLSIARKKDNRWSYKMIAQNTSKGISWKYCQRAVWSA